MSTNLRGPQKAHKAGSPRAAPPAPKQPRPAARRVSRVEHFLSSFTANAALPTMRRGRPLLSFLSPSEAQPAFQRLAHLALYDYRITSCLMFLAFVGVVFTALIYYLRFFVLAHLDVYHIVGGIGPLLLLYVRAYRQKCGAPAIYTTSDKMWAEYVRQLPSLLRGPRPCLFFFTPFLQLFPWMLQNALHAHYLKLPQATYRLRVFARESKEESAHPHRNSASTSSNNIELSRPPSTASSTTTASTSATSSSPDSVEKVTHDNNNSPSPARTTTKRSNRFNMPHNMKLVVVPPFENPRQLAEEDKDIAARKASSCQTSSRRWHLPDTAPVVFLCPGLACDAADLPGIHTILYAVLARGYRCITMERRGQGATLLESARFNVFGDTEDFEAVYHHVCENLLPDPAVPKFCVGISAGSALVVNGMGQFDRRKAVVEENHNVVGKKAAIRLGATSPPPLHPESGNKNENDADSKNFGQDQQQQHNHNHKPHEKHLQPENRSGNDRQPPHFDGAAALYPGWDIFRGGCITRVDPFTSRMLVQAMQGYFLSRNEAVLRAFDAKAYDDAMATKSFEEFMDHAAVFAGYPSGREAYDVGENPVRFLEDIRTPLLCIMAEDDPVSVVSNFTEVKRGSLHDDIKSWPEDAGRTKKWVPKTAAGCTMAEAFGGDRMANPGGAKSAGATKDRIGQEVPGIVCITKSGSHCPMLDGRLCPVRRKTKSLATWSDEAVFDFFDHITKLKRKQK